VLYVLHACHGHYIVIHPHNPSPTPKISHLSESRRTRVGEQLLARGLGGTMRQRELEVLLEELLDVRAADGVVVLDLNNLKDL
jgi:hypothetical protein